jgi:hypothetical protein
MQTVTLKINDSFYEHFMAIVDSLPKKQVKVVDKKIPSGIIVTSIEEAKQRVAAAEKSESLDDDTYKKEMSNFFKKEFGVVL